MEKRVRVGHFDDFSTPNGVSGVWISLPRSSQVFSQLHIMLSLELCLVGSFLLALYVL